MPRFFVPADSLAGGRLDLSGEAAARIYERGLRCGEMLVVLDNSGWETAVELEDAAPASCRGRVLGRHLAPERRTKVSLYHGLLHPSDFRRLLGQATALGVVAIVPLVTDGSIVPLLDPAGRAEGELEWPQVVRDAAEASGRGRCPTLGAPMLFDRALDEASRGATVLLADPSGIPLADALTGRPFSIDLICPPPGGFTAAERERAAARRVAAVRPPGGGPDPIQPALALMAALYEHLEVDSSGE